MMSVAVAADTMLTSFAPVDATWSANVSDGSTPRSAAALTPAYELESVNRVFAAVIPLRRLDWAARSFARPRAPRKVGMAMAIRMAMDQHHDHELDERETLFLVTSGPDVLQGVLHFRAPS